MEIPDRKAGREEIRVSYRTARPGASALAGQHQHVATVPIRLMFNAKHTRSHSPRTFAKRRRIVGIRTSLIHPFGASVALALRVPALPAGLASFSPTVRGREPGRAEPPGTCLHAPRYVRVDAAIFARLVAVVGQYQHRRPRASPQLTRRLWPHLSATMIWCSPSTVRVVAWNPSRWSMIWLSGSSAGGAAVTAHRGVVAPAWPVSFPITDARPRSPPEAITSPPFMFDHRSAGVISARVRGQQHRGRRDLVDLCEAAERLLLEIGVATIPSAAPCSGAYSHSPGTAR